MIQPITVNNQNGIVVVHSRNVTGVRILINKLTIRGIDIPRIDIDKRISKELNVLLIKFCIMLYVLDYYLICSLFDFMYLLRVCLHYHLFMLSYQST
jgi:hypothetical protein